MRVRLRDSCDVRATALCQQRSPRADPMPGRQCFEALLLAFVLYLPSCAPHGPRPLGAWPHFLVLSSVRHTP
eukprot:scaffold60114_cov33-Tisochrysis_lutea.AAC.2